MEIQLCDALSADQNICKVYDEWSLKALETLKTECPIKTVKASEIGSGVEVKIHPAGTELPKCRFSKNYETYKNAKDVDVTFIKEIR